MRFQENFPKSSEISIRLQDFFEQAEIEEIAKHSEFVKRESEMTGPKFAQMCIGGVTESGLMGSLNELCVLAMKLNADLCTQSLNERFNSKAVRFMEMLFERAIKHRFEDSTLAIMEDFSQIILEDSTTSQLPPDLANVFRGNGGTGSNAAIKFDYTYDLKASDFSLQLRQGRQPDSSMLLPDDIPAKSLWLRDLGYFRTDDFKKIAENNAFYVSRLRYDVKIYMSEQEDAQPIDLLKMLSKMKPNQVQELNVFVGKVKRFPARLVLQKVPKQVGDQKRKKLRTDKKSRKNYSKERLKFCDANAFVTNLEQEQWTAHQVMKLYKVRWQIEILFKVWKSTLKIGQVQKMKAERFLCLLYGQLIWAIICMRIFQAFKNQFWNQFKIEISELKTFKIMRTFNHTMIMAIKYNAKILYEQCLNQMYNAIYRFGKKQYKKGNPNPLFVYEKS
jgi:hypothetical protein